MKDFPEINCKQAELYEMLFGQARAKLLMSGIELGVFDHLSGPVSAASVATAVGGHPVNIGLLLDGLTAIGLLEKKNGLYRNCILAQTYLVKDNDTYLGGQLTSIAEQWFHGDILGLVREGPPPAPETEIVRSEEFWAYMAAGMANGERGGPAREAVKIVSALPEFSSFRKMLDLGSGPGLIGIAISAAHPDLTCVAFDRPAMVRIAERYIEEYGMTGRVQTLGGDYLKDPFGEGYDLVWASTCLNFAKHDIDTLMKKIYDSLQPGGVFVSLADGLTDERTAPELRVLESVVAQSLMGQDFYFDQGFLADAMLRAGFHSVRSRTIDSSWGPMDLDIGKKT
jgi:predicted O-methyltransferase YrrM